MRLAEQVVLVTGSSRGLGLSVAKAFHAEGAKLVINYIRNEEAAETIAYELDALAYRADVKNDEQVIAMFAAAEGHYGRPITTVVNNALSDNFQFNGDARDHLDAISWTSFDQQLQGALRGALNTTQSAIVGFREMGFGRIINIGSNLVQNPVVPYHDYTASKAALLAYTRTVAAELGPAIGSFTSNMVTTGLLNITDASRCTPDSVFEQIKAATPLRRTTTPEDVAGAVLFFASPWAAAVTGQQLIVDGGLVMS